jgi:hypothetical protein
MIAGSLRSFLPRDDGYSGGLSHRSNPNIHERVAFTGSFLLRRQDDIRGIA